VNRVTSICPHCVGELSTAELDEQKCRSCGGSLAFEDFRIRMVQLCALERIYNLKDPRKEKR